MVAIGGEDLTAMRLEGVEIVRIKDRRMAESLITTYRTIAILVGTGK